MRHLTRMFSFASWGVVTSEVLYIACIICVGVVVFRKGNYLQATVMALAIVLMTYLLQVSVRGRLSNNEIAHLRNQLRRELRRRLAGAESVMLVAKDNKAMALCSYMRVFFWRRYLAMVITVDDAEDTEIDWNLAFTQQRDLAKLQDFHFPPLWCMVEKDMWLMASKKDAPKSDPRNPMSPSYWRDRLRYLKMNAGHAGADELRWLLTLVQTGIPRALPEPGQD